MDLDTTTDLLRTLVAFDTVSSRSNRELIDWVANRLGDLGIDSFVQHGDEPGKANLFATIGPADRPGLMLSGHSDVVPVAGESWTSDPFTLTRRGERLYARGSADMKGFIACALAMAPQWAKAATGAGAGLAMPVHLALSYNEESNMHGMRLLAKHLSGAAVRPAAAIIGEPTSMRVVVANKGAAIWRCRVLGKPVHSSLRDRGVSAVEIAAEIIVFLNSLQRRLNQAERHDGFEFPHTSVHVGRISGGTAHNITARECEFVFEVRALPGVSAGRLAQEVRDHCTRELLPGMKAVSPDCDIVIDEVLDAPGLDERGNRHLAQVLMPMCGHLTPGRVSFGTEAGMLQEIGVETVIMGPGQIAVAHQADEFVEIEQLQQCLAFLERLGRQLGTGALQPA